MRGGVRTATVIAVLAGLALASCGKPPPAAPVAPPTGPLPGLERFYAQHLRWGSCVPFATTADQRDGYADAALDCTRLQVPLDYAQPAGRTAQIAVLRHRATGPKIGSLVVNPGGPGDSGVELAAGLTDDFPVGPFDVVGFDPRGVGRSTPTIDCDTDAGIDADRADSDYDPSPAGVARDEDRARKRAQRCIDRSGGVDVLANSGTRDVARDLDVLRAALGDKALTYLGFSYGTRIGTSYAEQFPSTVRAMVLDGAIDPNQTEVDRDVAQMAGFQKAFLAYADDCAGKPGCPLGSDPAKVTPAFQALTRPLIDHPAKVRGDARTLSYSDAVTGVEEGMYDSELWAPLTAALTRLRAGDGSDLLRLADQYYGRTAAGGYSNDNEALLVINCVDGERITDRAAVADEARRIAEVAPYADDGHGPSGALDTCAFLPVTPTSQAHLPTVAGLPPVLVISTTGDPATPYQAGVDLAAALHGPLLTVVGNKHTAADSGNPCVDAVVRAYLRRPTQPLATERCAPTAPAAAAGHPN
jgi:pimeloyl-ACP methyl ester carboxylesterase